MEPEDGSDSERARAGETEDGEDGEEGERVSTSPSVIQNPFFQSTLAIATSVSGTRTTAVIGVRKHAASARPPRDPASATPARSAAVGSPSPPDGAEPPLTKGRTARRHDPRRA